MNDLDRMKELIHTLNEAGKAYYQQNKEVMSNLEYDKMYDELLELEKKTNTVLSNSPTIHVGYELMTALEKEAHPSPMLSLDKTKEPDQLATWLNGQEGILSWKLDGLTIVLTYEHGDHVWTLEKEQEGDVPIRGGIHLGDKLFPLPQLQFATDAPDGIDIDHDLIVRRSRDAVIGCIRHKPGKYRFLRETDFFSLPLLD